MSDNTSDNRKLKVKLIIAIILFLLAIIMLILGIWASQAGKDRFKGYVSVTTEDLSARVTARVTGTKKTTGAGYNSDKVLWDSSNEIEDAPLVSWRDIDFTFADKNSVIELTITIENRKVSEGIDVIFNAKLGENMITAEEKEIGQTNIKAYIISQSYIGIALDENTPTTATFKVVLKIADSNKSVDATELEVDITLTDPE